MAMPPSGLLKTLLLISMVLLCVAPFGAAGSVEEPQRCVRCGMDRNAFARSRAQVRYADGSSSGTCSLHCAVEDVMKSPAKRLISLKVADYPSRDLIEAEGAVWVVGGRLKGVMTSPAKWAFRSREEAKRFVQENGGSMVSFPEVLRAVQLELEEMNRPPELE